MIMTYESNFTFAYAKELLQTSSYDDDKQMAEDASFLNNYETKVIQLDPMQSVLCMCHDQNAFDKTKCVNNKTLTNLYRNMFI